MANLIESENIDWNYGVIACKQINMESELHTHTYTLTHMYIFAQTYILLCIFEMHGTI